MFASYDYDFYPNLGLGLGILEQKINKYYNKIKNKKRRKQNIVPYSSKSSQITLNPQRLGFILNIVIWEESLNLGPGISCLGTWKSYLKLTEIRSPPPSNTKLLTRIDSSAKINK